MSPFVGSCSRFVAYSCNSINPELIAKGPEVPEDNSPASAQGCPRVSHSDEVNTCSEDAHQFLRVTSLMDYPQPVRVPLPVMGVGFLSTSLAPNGTRLAGWFFPDCHARRTGYSRSFWEYITSGLDSTGVFLFLRKSTSCPKCSYVGIIFRVIRLSEDSPGSRAVCPKSSGVPRSIFPEFIALWAACSAAPFGVTSFRDCINPGVIFFYC